MYRIFASRSIRIEIDIRKIIKRKNANADVGKNIEKNYKDAKSYMKNICVKLEYPLLRI